MRAFLTFSLLLGFFAVSCNTDISVPGTITGQLSGVEEGTTIFLRSYNQGVLVEVGKCVTDENGHFALTPEKPLKDGYHQIMIEKRCPLVLITNAEESPNIEANIPLENGYLTGPTITGSPSSALLASYYDIIMPLQDELMTSQKSYQLAEDLDKKELARVTKDLISAMNEVSLSFIKNNKNNPSTLAALENLNPATNKEVFKEVLSLLKDKYGDTHYFKMLNQKFGNSLTPRTLPKENPQSNTKSNVKRIKKNSKYMVGDMAPEIAMNDMDGNLRKLSDLRGKVVLLDFWASWCGPCRRENPHVVHAYNKYKSQGFEVFSVSLDSDAKRWRNAVEQDGLVWPNHVSDLAGWKNASAREYGISSIPHTMLIDRSGTIIVTHLRGPALEAELVKLFGK